MIEWILAGVFLYLIVGSFFSGVVYAKKEEFHIMDLVAIPFITVIYPILIIWFWIAK